MTSQRVKNKQVRQETKSSGVTVASSVIYYSTHVTSSVQRNVFCDLLQYTRTGKCNLFVLYNKDSNGLLKDFWGMKKEKQVC